MKQPYDKPKIFVESLTLDMPIAANCIADKDDMNSLISLGYFNAEKSCSFYYDEVDFGDTDTVCVHSNIQTAFTS